MVEQVGAGAAKERVAVAMRMATAGVAMGKVAVATALAAAVMEAAEVVGGWVVAVRG